MAAPPELAPLRDHADRPTTSAHARRRVREGGREVHQEPQRPRFVSICPAEEHVAWIWADRPDVLLLGARRGRQAALVGLSRHYLN